MSDRTTSLADCEQQQASYTSLLGSSHALRAGQALVGLADGGCYLGNQSLAAPPGVVEALDKERQELPPDQLPAGDDPGSLPADGGLPIQVWWGHEPIAFVIMRARPSFNPFARLRWREKRSQTRSGFTPANRFRLKILSEGGEFRSRSSGLKSGEGKFGGR